MNEAGYDLVAHKHYRERVINMMLVRCEGTRVSRTKRDRKLRGVCARVRSGATCSIPFIFHSIYDILCSMNFVFRNLEF